MTSPQHSVRNHQRRKTRWLAQRAGSLRAFTRHYVEMVAVMLAGMLAIQPLLDAVVGTADDRPEVDSLLMATSMSIPMAAWMRYRGHGVRSILEMTLAMYGGFVALFPLLWAGHLTPSELMVSGHVLMLLLMALAMVARPGEYASGHKQ